MLEAYFVPAQNTLSSQKSAEIINQLLFLQEVHATTSNSFFNADSVHFTDAVKYVDPTSYADGMSRSDVSWGRMHTTKK